MSTADLTAGTHLPLRGLPRPVPYVGPVAILGVVVAWVLMWAVSGPGDASTGSYLGQAIGALALLLMSTGLLLAGLGPQLERWFGGLDKTVVWHRGLSFVGFLLLFPHGWLAVDPALAGEETVGVMLGSGARFLLMVLMVWAVAPPLWRNVPQRARAVVAAPFRAVGRVLGERMRRTLRAVGGYDGWRSVHRFAALAVALGFTHGLVTATMFGDRPLLRWTYLVAGAIGLGAYLARLVLGQRLDPRHAYRVTSLTTTGSVAELVLAPEGEPLRFEAGQFAFVRFPGGCTAIRSPSPPLPESPCCASASRLSATTRPRSASSCARVTG